MNKEKININRIIAVAGLAVGIVGIWVGLHYKGEYNVLNSNCIINSPDSVQSNKQQGGITARDVDINIETEPDRHVNEEFTTELNKILPVNKNKEIFFGIVMGDMEARAFAAEIKQHLASEDRKVGNITEGNTHCTDPKWKIGHKDWGDRFEIYICTK